MNFDLTLNIGHVISLIGFIATATGLFIAVFQIKRNFKVQRAEFIRSITAELFDDSDLRKFFYEIDYEKFKFPADDIKSWKGCDNERRLDALLYKYDAIAKMVRINLVKLDDIEFLLFEFIQVLKNSEVQSYINWIDNEFDAHGSVNNNKRKRSHDNVRWLFELLENRT
ncbi:MAG: hypothetical protein A2464_03735 [Deltaproteobacteria bacterium RIFOXYC2_FULL_48_10]|nr:MAG: hypothetical protein A2464_03735 [Deltaproteobacteria bacterium RIFOXYC2_FULL_48_10]